VGRGAAAKLSLLTWLSALDIRMRATKMPASGRQRRVIETAVFADLQLRRDDIQYVFRGEFCL
jgi:hypothetical protein